MPGTYFCFWSGRRGLRGARLNLGLGAHCSVVCSMELSAAASISQTGLPSAGSSVDCTPATQKSTWTVIETALRFKQLVWNRWNQFEAGTLRRLIFSFSLTLKQLNQVLINVTDQIIKSEVKQQNASQLNNFSEAKDSQMLEYTYEIIWCSNCTQLSLGELG